MTRPLLGNLRAVALVTSCLFLSERGSAGPQQVAGGMTEAQSAAEAVERFMGLNRAVGQLFFAVEIGNDALALELIEAGADLSATFDGGTLLELAVKRGRLTVFQKLIDAGVAPESTSGRRLQASDLQLVGQRDRAPVGEQPAPVSAARTFSPLHDAAAAGQDVVVTRLLSAGEDVNQVDEDFWSALHGAAAAGQGSTVQLLIEAGANLELRGGPLHRTPLEVALAVRGNDASIAALRQGGVALLPYQSDAKGTTLLHLAAQNGYLHIMRELIALAAVTNAKSYRTAEKKQWVDTPIFSAVKRDETDAVVMLILRGAELNIKDHQGGTALWYAHGHSDGTTTRRLITGGADPNLAGRGGEPPLFEAVRLNKEEKQRVLLEMGAEVNAKFRGSTALHLVALGGTWEMATWLMDAGADTSALDGNGQTALQLAIQSGNHFVAHVLVPRPSDSLLLAMASMDLAAMDKALKLGANPTQNLSDGSTPLHQFARLRELGFEAAGLFLAAGANPNALDGEGNSPLSELIVEGANRPFIELLMGAGADGRLGSRPAAMLAQRLGDESLMALVSKRPGISKVRIFTRAGFPHPAAQAGKACEGFAGLADYAKALQQADRAVHEKPSNGRYRLYRAKLRAATGEAEGSLEDYARLLKDKPSWFDPKVDYGILLIQNGRFQEGLDHLDNVLTRFVGVPDAKLHFNRGQARAAVGDLQGALVDLQLAYDTNPKIGPVLRHLGLVQQSLGDQEAACESWKNAMEQGDSTVAELLMTHCH